jgi:uncharacterized protein (TIGR02466 family)
MIEQRLLFPTAIWNVNIDIGEEFRSYLNNLPLHEEHERFDKAQGGHSKDVYVLNQPECSELKTAILDICTKIARENMSKVVEEMIMLQSWVIFKKPGQSHNKHAHQNSFLSGVFYYDDIEYSPIVFHRPAVGLTNQISVEDNHEHGNQNPPVWHHYSFYPKRGDLVIFPSWLEHSVSPNTTDQVRKVLAFNVIPNKLGFAGGLDNLQVIA